VRGHCWSFSCNRQRRRHSHAALLLLRLVLAAIIGSNAFQGLGLDYTDVARRSAGEGTVQTLWTLLLFGMSGDGDRKRDGLAIGRKLRVAEPLDRQERAGIERFLLRDETRRGESEDQPRHAEHMEKLSQSGNGPAGGPCLAH